MTCDTGVIIENVKCHVREKNLVLFVDNKPSFGDEFMCGVIVCSILHMWWLSDVVVKSQ